MSDGKFTPGPWKAILDVPGRVSIFSADNAKDGKWIADLSSLRMPDETVANAALIAAAPDLYEALEVFVKQWELYKTVEPAAPGNDRDYPSITMRRESWDQAAAALSRANPQGEEK